MIEPGDEVIVTDPTYAGIINRVRLSGGIPVFVPLIPSATGWSLDTAALESVVSPRTRMVVISPGMPTGHVLTQREWEAVARVVIKADLWLLYDAAMERILYDGKAVIHPVSLPHMREHTITVGAASKELRMIGWRVGWVVGPKNIMNDIGLVSISNVVCQTGISMAGVAAGLNAQDDGLTDALTIWEERRNVLLKELDGLPVIPPQGGWSLLVDASVLKMTAQEMTERLFKEAKIATTPMVGWGDQAAKYVRFVFSNEPKERLIGIGKEVEKSADSYPMMWVMVLWRKNDHFSGKSVGYNLYMHTPIAIEAVGIWDSEKEKFCCRWFLRHFLRQKFKNYVVKSARLRVFYLISKACMDNPSGVLIF